MAKLIYMAIQSLDGYVEDESGNFNWAMPDQEVHAFVNDLERSVGTQLYGRRLYEVMIGWDTFDISEQPSVAVDFARIWQAADKIVYSKTLESVATGKTRIERDFDPAMIREMKASLPRDISVGGADLAGEAIRAGLVDEYHFLVSPIVVGAGKPSLPADVRVTLELLAERRFGNGVVHLHYRAS